MAKSSIHIGTGRGGYFAHNSRESKTENSIFSDEQNYCSCSKSEAFELFRSELKVRSAAYQKRTNQKLQSKAITHLSAIVNFNKDHTPEDIKKVCEYLEQKFDTKVIQYSMHRDEGHIIEDEEQEHHDSIGVNTNIKNYHAHIEFMGLDTQGNSVRRKLDKPTLKALQTEVADLLGMERGRKSGYNKKQYTEITSRLRPQEEYKSKEVYREAFSTVAQELGYKNDTKKAKRLDTYDFKAKKIAENEARLATQKELKAEITKLRAELQAQGAERAEYAELEALHRELKAQVKAKDLTIQELNKALEAQKELKATNDTLKERLEVLEANTGVISPNHKEWIEYGTKAKERIKELKSENSTLKQQGEAALERAEKAESKVVELEAEVSRWTSMFAKKEQELEERNETDFNLDEEIQNLEARVSENKSGLYKIK